MTRRLFPFLAIALVGSILDIFSKFYVFHLLESSPAKKLNIISNVLEFEIKRNSGIIWGFFQGANWLAIAIISLLAIPLILVVFFFSTKESPKTDWLITISLGLILSGAIGNLFDRFAFGSVRDFIHYYYIIDWPHFNLADAFITCGVILMLLSLFRKQPSTEKKV